MADIRRGTGPDALPQGAASQLNAAAIPPQPGMLEGPGAEVPVEFAKRADVEDESLGPLSENMEILLGQPNPGYQPPAVADIPQRMPRRIVQSLPLLQAIARNPDSPPAAKAMYRWAVRRLEQEMRQGG